MFPVIWLQRAVNDLAEIWMHAAATGRRAITEASHAIDGALQDKPFDVSESREEDVRVMFAPPLGIFFTADFASRTVTVAHVWRYQGPRRRA